MVHSESPKTPQTPVSSHESEVLDNKDVLCASLRLATAVKREATPQRLCCTKQQLITGTPQRLWLSHTASAGTTDTVITGGMYFSTGESAAIAAGAGAMYSTTRAGTAIAAGAGVMHSTPGTGAVVTARAVALYSSTVTSAAINATAVRCTPTSARVLQLLEELVRCPQPPTQEIAAVETIKCTTGTGASNIAKAGKRTPNVPHTAPSCERSDDRPEPFNVLLKTKMKIALSSLVKTSNGAHRQLKSPVTSSPPL